MTNSNNVPTEAIFIPIDLEMSLGKIEDSKAHDDDAMECEPTRTSNHVPFRDESEIMNKKESHIIAPFPLTETDAEIREREKLTKVVGDDWSLTNHPNQTSTDNNGCWAEGSMDLELIPNDHDDDFSISSDPGIMQNDDVEFEKIEDPVTFWESAPSIPSTTIQSQQQQKQPDVIPLSNSFRSTTDNSRRSSL